MRCGTTHTLVYPPSFMFMFFFFVKASTTMPLACSAPCERHLVHTPCLSRAGNPPTPPSPGHWHKTTNRSRPPGCCGSRSSAAFHFGAVWSCVCSLPLPPSPPLPPPRHSHAPVLAGGGRGKGKHCCFVCMPVLPRPPPPQPVVPSTLPTKPTLGGVECVGHRLAAVGAGAQACAAEMFRETTNECIICFVSFAQSNKQIM